jgi:hypothetical protein
MRRTLGWLSIAASCLLGVACHRRGAAPLATSGESATASGGRRVIVEVINPGKRPGVARVVTLRLREQPQLDVVYFGNQADTALAKRDRNLIYVRRGDTTGVGLVIAAIGDADIVDRGDPTRFVDLSVIPGKNFGTAVAH